MQEPIVKLDIMAQESQIWEQRFNILMTRLNNIEKVMRDVENNTGPDGVLMTRLNSIEKVMRDVEDNTHPDGLKDGVEPENREEQVL